MTPLNSILEINKEDDNLLKQFDKYTPRASFISTKANSEFRHNDINIEYKMERVISTFSKPHSERKPDDIKELKDKFSSVLEALIKKNNLKK